MKKKFNKIPSYWQKVLANQVFGCDDDCVMGSLSLVNPEVDEESLCIKVEAKNNVYRAMENCRKKPIYP